MDRLTYYRVDPRRRSVRPLGFISFDKVLPVGDVSPNEPATAEQEGDIRGATIRPQMQCPAGYEFSVNIATRTRLYIVCADDERGQEEWVSAINKAFAEYCRKTTKTAS